MIRHRFALTLLLAAALPPRSALSAQTPAKLPTETYTLPNGLRVILAENHNSQVVTVDLWYAVGSRNEVPGRTGFAHLFEHMMFEGTEHVKKAEHFALVANAGGGNNASTHSDFTNYYQFLPSNQVNLGLWLEADRMRSLTVTDETFHNQREAVKEERRLRIDNQPYARVIVEGIVAAFDSAACYGYAHPGIGHIKDLDAAATSDVKAFFDLYYVPNNATLAVVGDIDPAAVKKTIVQYFGNIPRGKEPPPVRCEQKFSTGALRKNFRDDKATLPASVTVYRVPSYDNADTPAIDLLLRVLGQGESSRLNVKLVRDARAAVAAQALSFGATRGPGLVVVLGIANQGVSIDSVGALASREVARVAAEGITEQELTKAKNGYRAQVINDRQHSFSYAEALQSADFFLGSARAIDADFDRHMKVTVADVKRAASTYLTPDNSLTLMVSAEAKP